MGNYKAAEERIRELQFDKVYLESIKNKLELLELEYCISGIAYDGIGGGSEISDRTGDTALRVSDQKTKLELKAAKVKADVAHLESVLNCLTAKEYEIIILYYTKYKSIEVIAGEVVYSPSQVKRIKGDAMRKIVKGLYGKES